MIAIMGILVGVVGTQVVPYMEKGREAKDQQILSSVATAITSAIAMSGESEITISPNTKLDELPASIKGEVESLLMPEQEETSTETVQSYLAKKFVSKKAKSKTTVDSVTTTANTIFVSYFPDDGKLYVFLTKTGTIISKTESGGTTITGGISTALANGAEPGDDVILYVESN